MLLRSLSKFVLAAALVTSAAFGADVTGKWKMSFTTPNGETRESTLMLKADGDKLTGSMEGPRGSQEISDGKVDGDKVSFAVVRNFNGNEMKIQYKGQVSGDEMKLTMGMGQRQMEITAKRVQ